MMRAMTRHAHNPNADLLDATIEAFQPLSPELLSREDAAEILDNLGRFGAILQRWSIRKAARDASCGGGAQPCQPDVSAEVSP